MLVKRYAQDCNVCDICSRSFQVVFTRLIDRVKPHTENATQTLILAHRQELVEQAAKHCTNAYPGKTVEVEMSNMHASGNADITVASIQSIVSGNRMEKFNPANFKLVLVDEAHHVVAPGYMKTLEYFGLSEGSVTKASPALVGVSATFSRFDGLKLGAAIDEIVYHKDYINMIEENWLSGVIFTTVRTQADLSRVKKGFNGDFQPSELSAAVNTNEVNELTVRTWLAKAQGRKSTLAFCVDLAHVSGLTNTFRQHGIDARFVSGDTPKNERSTRLDSFKKGEFPVLVNCGVFTEGTDIPNIDCILLARPTKSRNLLVQMIGRGMRLHPGKLNCHVIDMAAALDTGIVTTPTLFGLDPSELVEEADPSDMKGLKERKELEDQRQKEARQASTKVTPTINSKSLTFTDYDSVYDLIGDAREDRNVRSHSQNAWVSVGNDSFILPAKGSYLRVAHETVDGTDLKSDGESYMVTEHTPLVGASKHGFRRPRTIASDLDLEAAIHAADTYAGKKFPIQLISRNMLWRRGPATESQVMFLNKLRLQDDQLTATDITKGQAVDMITKIKHGAKGRFQKLQAGKKRELKAKDKKEMERLASGRENVVVGPLSKA